MTCLFEKRGRNLIERVRAGFRNVLGGSWPGAPGTAGSPGPPPASCPSCSRCFTCVPRYRWPEFLPLEEEEEEEEAEEEVPGDRRSLCVAVNYENAGWARRFVYLKQASRFAALLLNGGFHSTWLTQSHW